MKCGEVCFLEQYLHSHKNVNAVLVFSFESNFGQDMDKGSLECSCCREECNNYKDKK